MNFHIGDSVACHGTNRSHFYTVNVKGLMQVLLSDGWPIVDHAAAMTLFRVPTLKTLFLRIRLSRS